MKSRMDRVINALVFVRIGQELGTDSPVARVVHDLLELLSAIPVRFFV